MPSVDETLRHAFGDRDEQWMGRTEPAQAAVRARHRRQQLVRRGLAAGAVSAAAIVASVAIANQGPEPRTVEPVLPPPTSATAPVTPLEGTWTSEVVRATDVRAAARDSGEPASARYMLDQLPGLPFRVTLLVAGDEISTSVTPLGGVEQPLDQETFEVDGAVVRLAPPGLGWHTDHTWAVDGSRLQLSFRSTTEDMTGGVPGEAWQRLLYDTAVFTRSQ